ncbi:MAG: ATP-binding protein [Deltaproteobacteria bacterium]|nr:ATP-binding protein [Deltaproteobacteria bacterium]
MTDDLAQLLENLKLRRLAEILDQELERVERDRPAYGTWLARLLREEWHAQDTRSIENRIKRAQVPERWALETFPWDRQPTLHRGVIEQIASLDFISRASNLVFIGPTGVGKTGLAIGVLLKALQAGRRGYFVLAQNLFDEMYRSLADRSSRRLLNRLAGYDLLVIDEMGYLNLRPEQSNIFFKLMEERYGKRSTIITTNLEYEEWHAFLGQKDMVSALLDRLRHHCTTVRIEGSSLRQPSG